MNFNQVYLLKRLFVGQECQLRQARSEISRQSEASRHFRAYILEINLSCAWIELKLSIQHEL